MIKLSKSGMIIIISGLQNPNKDGEKSKTRANIISPMLNKFILSWLMNGKELNKK